MVLTLALAKVAQGSDDVPHKSPITVGKYCSFLAAVAEFQDAHGLYQPDMEDQIISTQEGDQKKYRVVEGQEEELMGNMTRLDAMRYCNWKEHHSPNDQEDPVTASLSTETGIYDLQDDQLVCFHAEAGDHLFNDDEGSPFFWITAEAEEEEYSPLMMVPFGEQKKREPDQQKDPRAIEDSRFRGEEDPSADLGRGTIAHIIEEASQAAPDQVPKATCYEAIKSKLLAIWNCFKRFFGARGEVAVPAPIDRLAPDHKATVDAYIAIKLAEENTIGVSLASEAVKQQIHNHLATLVSERMSDDCFGEIKALFFTNYRKSLEDDILSNRIIPRLRKDIETALAQKEAVQQDASQKKATSPVLVRKGSLEDPLIPNTVLYSKETVGIPYDPFLVPDINYPDHEVVIPQEGHFIAGTKQLEIFSHDLFNNMVDLTTKIESFLQLKRDVQRSKFYLAEGNEQKPLLAVSDLVTEGAKEKAVSNLEKFVGGDLFLAKAIASTLNQTLFTFWPDLSKEFTVLPRPSSDGATEPEYFLTKMQAKDAQEPSFRIRATSFAPVSAVTIKDLESVKSDALPVTLTLEDPPRPLNFKQECQTTIEFEVKKNPSFQAGESLSLENFPFSLTCLAYLNRYHSEISGSSSVSDESSSQQLLNVSAVLVSETSTKVSAISSAATEAATRNLQILVDKIKAEAAKSFTILSSTTGR